MILTHCRKCGLSFPMRNMIKGDLCDECKGEKAQIEEKIRAGTRMVLPLIRRIALLEDRVARLEARRTLR